MKKVSFTDIKKAKWVLPAGVVTLGLALMVSGQTGGRGSKAAVTGANSATVQAQTAESPAPTAASTVTVNGTQVPTDRDGSADVPAGNGKAHVEVSGGHTRITTNDSGTSGDTSNNQSGNVEINMSSQTSGGTNSGVTQVYGSSYSSNNGSSSYNNTSIFSTGADHVSVSQ
ncbi:MAG TPA: hypothetical protein VMT30_00880 [Candidatus Saccharimonadia bacterium]|nr:hypothetical protein [Candidatus Saccharimonadia bacterium]